MSRARIFVLAAFALLVLAIVAPPFVNINRFRHIIVQSIGAGLDRPVYANAVELTLFPRPAFVLHHLTVEEWPAYGAEPAIMAETVTASLRASTLWHRRVEIASLHFDAPSVNLTRDNNGQWNFESLISNSQVLQLPGSSSAASFPSLNPPPFPYVEATDARINFKLGTEKLPFSLEGADLAFWKESGNEWHVRIKARPVRTDLPNADAGQILSEATLKTSGVLMDAPIQASLEWRRGQLGEISRLLHGDDSGWRGSVDWTANVQGTLAKALVTTDIQVEEFRRAEFIPPSEMDLAAHCTAVYVRANRRPDSIDCNAPVGGGHLLVKSNARDSSPAGNAGDSVRSIRPLFETHPVVRVMLQHISSGFFLELLRHVHPGVAADTSVSGEVNGGANCEWRGLETLPACSGELHSTPLALSLPHVEQPLHLSPILISSVVATTGSGKISGSRRSAKKAKRSHETGSVSAEGAWNLAPSHVSLAGATPALVSGTLTSSGIALNMDGPADLTELNQLARVMNSPVISGGIRSIRGTGQMELTLQSNWLPQMNPAALAEAGAGNPATLATAAVPWFSPSQWGGTVQIHNATLQLGSFPGTFQIATAQVDLTPTGVEWTGLTGTYAHMPFDGSIGWQTSCPASRPPCARSFHLHTSNLDIDRFQAALRHTSDESGLLAELNPWATGIPELPEISGTFNSDVLSVGKLSLKNASFQLRLQGHRAELVAISGEMFGGTLSGIPANAPVAVSGGIAMVQPGEAAVTSQKNAIESGAGSAQWGDGAPIYSLRATLRNIQPDLVAAIWHEKWGKGTATAEIRLNTRGWSTEELAQHASGNFDIDWRDGALAASLSVPTPSAATEDLLGSIVGSSNVTRFQRLHAAGSIRNQTLVLNSGQLVLASPRPRRRALLPATQSLSGTVTFSRLLDLRLQPLGISITGPIDTPIMKIRPAKIPIQAGGLAP